MLVSNGGSRNAVEEQLRELRQQETNLLDAILNHDGSMKDKILQLAQTMEQRINLLDPMLPKNLTINQISSEIRRSLLSLQIPIGNYVHEYLPDKYKDEIHSRCAKLRQAITKIENTDRMVKPCENIEQCSAEELPQVLENEKLLKNAADDFVTEAKKEVTNRSNRIIQIRQRAMDLGIDHLLDESYRRPITCYDFRMSVPDDQQLEFYNKQTSENLIATGEVITEFGAKDFLDFPPLDIDDAKRFTETSRIWRIIFATVKEKKWSGSIGFWMDRNYWQKVQSSHDSGNSTKFDSTLCAWCSRDIDKDPEDRHIMNYDKKSPTLFRCDNCHGTAVLDKGNTREQVGDKKEENDRLAADIIDYAPFYGDIFEFWREAKWGLNPTVYGRKRAIKEPFSKAAFGKEDIVVPKNKK